jgi:glyoxylase-like metal-dependent hydrolase (beta-lactamase superfamily II)
MKVLIQLCFSFFFLALSYPVYSGGDHHAPTKSFKSTALTESIYLLRGKGGNILLVKGEQGLVMVDADYKEMSDALALVLTEHGGVENVTYLINTHWHSDHTQGNELLGHHAQIVAHDNVRSRLLTRQEIKLFNMVSEPYPQHALPSLTYSQVLSLFINGETFEIVHFPNGHTDGDSVVFMKEANLVHMGDHFFSGMFPFVDVDNGGDVMQMADNVAAVLARIDDDTIVIPGHGPLSDKSELSDYHDMLLGTVEEVKAMMAQGLTVAEMQEEGLSLDWEEWANGLISADAWIAIIVSSIQDS